MFKNGVVWYVSMENSKFRIKKKFKVGRNFEARSLKKTCIANKSMKYTFILLNYAL